MYAHLPELDKRLVKACAELDIYDILNALSAGANIKLKDSCGRRLLAITMNEAETSGRKCIADWNEERQKRPSYCTNDTKDFEEELLTIVIALIGQDLTLFEEEGQATMKVCRERNYHKVINWLHENAANPFSPPDV